MLCLTPTASVPAHDYRAPAQAKARRNLFHPGAMTLAELRPRRIPFALDPQTLGPAVEGQDSPYLAGTPVEEQAPLAHRHRQPRPSSSMRVS